MVEFRIQLVVWLLVLFETSRCSTVGTRAEKAERIERSEIGNYGNHGPSTAATTRTAAAAKPAKPTEPGRNVACADVQQIFVVKSIGLSQMVPDAPISGSHLEVCTSESTCCTKEMESKYKEAVQKDFLSIMHTTSSYVKNLIATNAEKLQENLSEMVRSSANNTYVLFSEVYAQMAVQAREPVGQLYADLSAFLQGRELNLEESVGDFFDTLFPLVYRHIINPKLWDLSNDYKECMQETQPEIQPFGDLPRRTGVHLAKALATARVLLQALPLGVEVMNATEHAPITRECANSLLRLTYCPHCQGLVAVKPCNGYCINVVRGCLANVAEMDQPWNDYVAALERLTIGMKGVYDPEEVLASLDTRITEAIMFAMENGPEISKKVKRACGQPKRAARQIQPPPSADAEPEKSTQAGQASPTSAGDFPEAANPPSLHLRLQNFVKGLSPSKGFYSTLAETLCTDDHLAVRRENDCWNGRITGEYSKTIVGIGVSAQKYNPEMNTSRHVDEKIIQLMEKLKHMRQVIMSRIAPAPESDSMVNDGSGSGYSYNNNINDDEDYEDGSGSGYEETAPNRNRKKPVTMAGEKNVHPGGDISPDEDITMDGEMNNNIDSSHHQNTKGGGPSSRGNSAFRLPAMSTSSVSLLALTTLLLRAWLCSSG